MTESDKIAHSAILSDVQKLRQRVGMAYWIAGGARLLSVFQFIYERNAQSFLLTQIKSMNGQASVAKTASEELFPTFRNVTTQGLTLLDLKGNIVGILSPLGLVLKEGIPIELDSPGGEITYINGGSITISTKPFDSTFGTQISDGSLTIHTSGGNLVTLGDLNPDYRIQQTAGLFVAQEIDASGKRLNGGGEALMVTPESINMTDDAGIDRVSIGETDLDTPETGAKETTALSSIVLFNETKHIIWQTP